MSTHLILQSPETPNVDELKGIKQVLHGQAYTSHFGKSSRALRSRFELRFDAITDVLKDRIQQLGELDGDRR